MRETKIKAVKARVSTWLLDNGYQADVFNQMFKIVVGGLKIKVIFDVNNIEIMIIDGSWIIAKNSLKYRNLISLFTPPEVLIDSEIRQLAIGALVQSL